MQDKTLEITVDNISAQIMVMRATVLIGFKQQRIKEEAKIVLNGKKNVDAGDIDRYLIHQFLYADVAACTTGTLIIDGEQTAWPPDLDVFLSLPDDLVAQVQEAVYQINPHWLPEEKGAEAKKKAPIDSTSG